MPTFHEPISDNGSSPITQCLPLYPGINILEGAVPGRVGVCLTYGWCIHQARAKPISHCQKGACGILSPWEAVTEQVLFHYALSGQSLIMPFCCSIMLFISVVCTGRIHSASFPLLGPNQCEPRRISLLKSIELSKLFCCANILMWILNYISVLNK